MKKPRRREGYDILIWIDKDGDVVAAAYSASAHGFFKAMDPGYTYGDIVELVASPDDFLKEVPDSLRVGGLHPETNFVSEMKKNSLH